MTDRSYTSVGTLARYWHLLLKNYASDRDAWTHLLGQHANGVLVCDPPLRTDPKDLWLDPEPRTGSRTMDAPHIWVRTDDGVEQDASAFKAWLLEGHEGAFGVDDSPPRRSPPAEALAPGGYPPQYVGPHERAKLEEQRRHNALIHEQNELLEAVKAAALARKEREREPPALRAPEPVEKESDAVPADTRKPSAIEDLRQADVVPHDDKALRKWILITCDRWGRSVRDDGLNKWLRAKYVTQFGDPEVEDTLRRQLDRHLEQLKVYPREW
jgi:hypothetical protein